MIIDSHHHLWRYSPHDYPWIGADSRLAQDYLIRELQEACRPAGVTGTVVVQARQSLTESWWLLDLAGQCDLICAVVGWAPLRDPRVAELLGDLAEQPKFKAVRHVLQDEPDEFFRHADFHRGLGQLPRHGLRYDILIYQHQLPLAIELADRQPNLGCIVDHLAKPAIHNGRIEEDWRNAMRELARRPNILGVKVSGLATEVRDAAIDEPTLHAYFLEALEIFGPERLMFGTDWPVCLRRIDAYQAWADMVRRWLEPLSEHERHAILAGNCARAYRL